MPSPNRRRAGAPTLGPQSPSFRVDRLDADGDGQACEHFDYAGGSVDDGPDDHQYNTAGKEVTVIVETIPDKRVLVDTGGPGFVTIGVFVALGFMGLGVYLLRRT